MQSHPSWVRGLKSFKTFLKVVKPTSHPSWVRGLKFHGCQRDLELVTVAPLVGAWIEIYFYIGLHTLKHVAPLVGAWIEISGTTSQVGSLSLSHPSWVRGLKFHLKVLHSQVSQCVAPLVGAWIEMLSPKF